MGGGLSRDDIRRLTRAYLQQLGEEVDGDQNAWIEILFLIKCHSRLSAGL